MSCSLDTNIILSLVLPDREKQLKKVEQLLEKFDCEVADLVFIEVEYVLRKVYGFTRADIVKNIRAIIGVSAINCNSQLYEKALILYEKNSAISFADSCLVVYAKLNRATPLYTFDKKLVNQSDGLAKLVK